VTDGVSRSVDGSSHAWYSAGKAAGEWLSLRLKKPAVVRKVQLTFDSDFMHDKRITLSSQNQS